MTIVWLVGGGEQACRCDYTDKATCVIAWRFLECSVLQHNSSGQADWSHAKHASSI